MDRPWALSWLVVSGILLELVCGAPLFWNLPQRDCDQPVSYTYDSYQQQPGPSYQETLQQMVQETLVALRDIVFVTAQVTRQELQALAKDLYSKVHRNCDSESAEDEDPVNSDNGQGAERPEEHEEDKPLQNGSEDHEEDKPLQNGSEDHEDNKPLQNGSEDNEENKPLQNGSEDHEENIPLQNGSEDHEENKPLQNGSEDHEENKPLQNGPEDHEENKPLQNGSEEHGENKPMQNGSEDHEENKPLQNGSEDHEENKPLQNGSEDHEENKPLQNGSEEHGENKPLQNGYHYDNPNKKNNIFATENTAPNPHDTDKGGIDNEIDLNKQIFENEISIEDATKFSETTTGVVEEMTSKEEMTTELVVTSTITAS